MAQTHYAHQSAFEARGLDDAFSRVIALVVQPGVEFSHSDVIHFDADRAKALSATLSAYPGIVFEAHSTDYQTIGGLRALVANGFAILKVGPWLTFALREALYALDAVADVLEGGPPKGGLMAKMEDIMTAAPGNWKDHYEGDTNELWLQRHFSYLDRIRYYWPTTEAESRGFAPEFPLGRETDSRAGCRTMPAACRRHRCRRDSSGSGRVHASEI